MAGVRGADLPNDNDERELIARLRKGDQAAYAELVEKFSPRIYDLALRLLGDEAEAEDVLQETFLSAFKNMGSFEGRASVGTWLYRIATNAALMRLRRKQPLFVSVDGGISDDEDDVAVPRQLFDWCCLPESDLLSEEASAEMRAAVDELPDSLRTVVVLRDIEGFSTRETARILGISESAVKSRLMRARMALRERLSGYFAELVPSKSD